MQNPAVGQPAPCAAPAAGGADGGAARGRPLARARQPAAHAHEQPQLVAAAGWRWRAPGPVGRASRPHWRRAAALQGPPTGGRWALLYCDKIKNDEYLK